MKQHEAQPLVLDIRTQVRGISSPEVRAGHRTLGWWWGELGWLSFRLASSLRAVPAGKGGRRAGGEQLAGVF